jgi:very-short-patch-repair endonuclease
LQMTSGNETSGERSRQLRARATEVERKQWGNSKRNAFAGSKFRRQHPSGLYLADFCCTGEFLIARQKKWRAE